MTDLTRRSLLGWFSAVAGSAFIPAGAWAIVETEKVELKFLRAMYSSVHGGPMLNTNPTFVITVDVPVGLPDKQRLDKALELAFPQWRKYWADRGCDFDDNGRFVGYNLNKIIIV